MYITRVNHRERDATGQTLRERRETDKMTTVSRREGEETCHDKNDTNVVGCQDIWWGTNRTYKTRHIIIYYVNHRERDATALDATKATRSGQIATVRREGSNATIHDKNDAIRVGCQDIWRGINKMCTTQQIWIYYVNHRERETTKIYATRAIRGGQMATVRRRERDATLTLTDYSDAKWAKLWWCVGENETRPDVTRTTRLA